MNYEPAITGLAMAWTPLVVVLLAMVLGLWVLLVILSRCLFGMHHLEFELLTRKDVQAIAAATPDPDGGVTRALLIDYSWDELDALKRYLQRRGGYHLLDVSLQRHMLGDETLLNLAAKPWIILNLEAILMHREDRLKCLDFLERLSSRDECRIYFFSEISPLARLRQAREREKNDERRGHGAGDVFLTSHEARESFRWSSLFADFVTFYGAPTVIPSKDQNTMIAQLVNREFAAVRSTKIQRQRKWALDTAIDDPEKTATREATIAYLAGFLGDYYQRQWLKCSKEEHLALLHLAQGRFINAANFVVLGTLLQRGLIARDPEFRLMNESFGYWIRMVDHPVWFEEFRRRSEKGGAWRLLRLPVLLGVIAAATAVAFVDRGGSDSILTLLPAVAAAIPLLLTQLSMVRQNIQR